MHRFFIPPGVVTQGQLCLEKNESHHALKVLRVVLGEAVELFDGVGGVFRGVVSRIDRSEVWVQIDHNALAAADRRSLVDVTLAVSVIKPEKMDLIFQRSTELGVRRIIPVTSERSVVRLSKERWAAKIERWKKIVAESCKQCGGPLPPAVENIQKLEDLSDLIQRMDLTLIPTLAVPGKEFNSAMRGLKAKNILVMIGPEGDFTDREVSWVVSRGGIAVSLGALVMRTETAAFYMLSVLNYLSGELSSDKS